MIDHQAIADEILAEEGIKPTPEKFSGSDIIKRQLDKVKFPTIRTITGSAPSLPMIVMIVKPGDTLINKADPGPGAVTVANDYTHNIKVTVERV
jgi:hypothetical protein